MTPIDSTDPLQAEVAAILVIGRLLPRRDRATEAALARWLAEPTENRRGAWYLALRLGSRAATAAVGN